MVLLPMLVVQLGLYQTPIQEGGFCFSLVTRSGWSKDTHAQGMSISPVAIIFFLRSFL